jgi:predicted RNA binding protein YcfA (HicA-like mRNA interferase family)
MRIRKFCWEEKRIWDQLKNITSGELISALTKDKWVQDFSRGAVLVFRHPDSRRVTIHQHPQKTYGEDLLKDLLKVINWTEDDLKRLKLIKKVG